MLRFLAIFMVFNFIIFIHEFGHYISAKLLGMRVLEFSMFVGPKIFSFTRNETMYSLRLIPIMAYVKLEGEEQESDREDSYSKKPVWARAIVIFAGPFLNILSALLFIWIYYSIAGFPSTVVERIAPLSPAAVAGLQRGDKVLSYNGNTVYSTYELLTFAFADKDTRSTIEVERSNEVKSFSITPLKDPKFFFLGFVSDPRGLVIKGFSDISPIKNAGAKVGDRITRIDNQIVKSVEDVRRHLISVDGKPVKVHIIRDESTNIEYDLDVKPRIETAKGLYYLGIEMGYKKGNLLENFVESIRYIYTNARSVVYTVGWLFQGKAQVGQLMGPVGIIASLNEAVKTSPTMMEKIMELLEKTALISVAIGCTNLVPFPALDGNKLVILGLEAIRRKPIPVKYEAFISMIGFTLLILMAIFITSKDIMRFVFNVWE